ncbi:MAG: Na/Pi symporter [Planctomycetaceae bacterium]|nr:Na/Pi symporter [Planctomycetaceae bacterium]
MTVGESLPLFLTGLVFFFIGLDGIKASLKALSSRSMRRRAHAAVSSPLRAAALGATLGALSQSATAVSFLLAGLVSTRLLPSERALSVVAWANPGTTILAFLAAVNLNVATLWLVGLAGLGLRNRRFKRTSAMLGALLGIGFLLYGLTQLKRAAAPLHESDWFATATIALNGSLVLGFVAGALLRVLIQSSSAIVVVLIALCGKGLLEIEQTIMIVHGTGVGIGLSVLLLGQGLRGEALRISYWQAILNACAAVGLGAWMLFAATGLIPSLPSLLEWMHLSIEVEIAVAFLIQMLLCPLAGRLLSRHAAGLLASLAPEAREDELAKVRFLDEGALEASEIAIELVGREQARIVGALPALLDRSRLDATATSGLKHADVRASLESLNTEISGFLAELAATEKDHARGVQIASTIARQQSLAELVEAVDTMSAVVERLPVESTARMLGGGLTEATDVLVGTLRDWLELGDAADRELLDALTSDRSEQMESVRRNSAAADFGSAEDRAAILYATSLFERTVYLARRVADRDSSTSD